MDPSDLNKYSFEKVDCFNQSCPKHWIRIKNNAEVNFCSLDCLQNPSTQARLTNLGPQLQPQANQMYQFALSAALNAMTLYSTAFSSFNSPFNVNKGCPSPLNLCTAGYDTIDNAASASPKNGVENKVVATEENMEIVVNEVDYPKCEFSRKMPSASEPTKESPVKKARMNEIEATEENISAGNPFFSINQQRFADLSPSQARPMVVESPLQARPQVIESPSHARPKVVESPSQARPKVVESPSQARPKIVESPAQAQQQVTVKMPAPAKIVKIKCKDVTCHPGPSALKSYFPKFYDVEIGKITPNRQVIRTHANKTTDVYFQTPEMQDIAAELSEEIQGFCTKGYGAVLDNFKVGDTCIAPYFDVFYRGIITKVKPDAVKIFFMDFGNEEVVDKNEKIYNLPPVFERLPRLASHGQWDLALSKEVSEDDLIDILNDEELNTNIQQKIADGQYLIRIGDRAPNMRFVIKPEVCTDPDSEEVYEVEFH